MKIEHVAVYYQDLERAREFFETYFSAECGEMYHNKTTGFRSYFLTFKDGARLEIMSHPEALKVTKPLRHCGYHHLAFSVGSKELVDALTERFVNDGYQKLSGPRTTGDGYYESCILDFEDNQIEITI